MVRYLVDTVLLTLEMQATDCFPVHIIVGYNSNQFPVTLAQLTVVILWENSCLLQHAYRRHSLTIQFQHQ